MKPLRCLIADIPQKVLADIVQLLTQQDENIEVVGQMNNLEGLSDVLEKQAIDILIVGIDKCTAPLAYWQLMEKFSDLLIVGLVDDGRMAVTYMSNIGKSDLLNIIQLKRAA